MFKNDDLTLYEQFLLLALKDEEGTFISMTNYHFAIGGAILAELLLNKRIEVQEKKKAKYINLLSEKLTKDEILNECILMVRDSKRRTRIENWVTKFANIKRLKHRIADQLCAKGILKEGQDKVLLLFNRKIYPEVNPIPEKKLISALRDAVYSNSDKLDPRTIILISIAKSTDMLRTFLTKPDIKKYKKRIEQISNGELMGKAAKEAVEAMQAAVFVAAILPAVLAGSVAGAS